MNTGSIAIGSTKGLESTLVPGSNYVEESNGSAPDKATTQILSTVRQTETGKEKRALRP